MEVEELIFAKCICKHEEDKEIELGKYYVVDEIHIGQTRSSVRVGGIYYNSICFKYYDNSFKEIDIYHSKYSPYFKEEDKKEGFVVNNHRHVHNENGLSIFPVEEDKEIELLGKITDDDGYIDQDDVINIGEKVNELIKAVNELKKGK